MSLDPLSRGTLADVLTAIQGAVMTERRRQDMASAVRSAAKVLGRDPTKVPIDMRTLNPWLERASPKAMGMSSSRWNNVRSLLRAAIALVQPMMSGRQADPISEAWAGLYDGLTKRADRIRLSRLVRRLSLRQINPDTVKLEDLEEFHRALCEEALVRDAEATWTDTRRAWNRALEYVPGWPQIPIPRAPRRNVIRPSLVGLPCEPETGCRCVARSPGRPRFCRRRPDPACEPEHPSDARIPVARLCLGIGVARTLRGQPRVPLRLSDDRQLTSTACVSFSSATVTGARARFMSLPPC